MPALAVPSSGDPGICTAVALGWQVAELYHSPVHQGAVTDPPRRERLPGRSDFPGATQSRWLCEQIETNATALLPAKPPALDDALSAALTVLADPQRDRSATLAVVFTMHCRLLQALTVADFRLAKAYGLGRAVAETAIVPADASERDRRRQFLELFNMGRLITIKDWLFDLKTLLPDHTAYVVSRSLDDWRAWATGERQAADWRAARGPIRVQGHIWRELLTGEKAGKDMLSMSDYLAAARQVATRVIVSLRLFWWLIGLAVLLSAGVIVAISYLHNIPPTVRLIVNLAWVAGVLGVSLRGTGALLGIALKDAEGWLWQAELDESIAIAATRLPPPDVPRRETGGSIGQLSMHPDRSAEQRRRDELRSEAARQPGATSQQASPEG